MSAGAFKPEGYGGGGAATSSVALSHPRRQSSLAHDRILSSSWDQPALEELVGDRCRDPVEEGLTHLRVFVEQTNDALFDLFTSARWAMAALGRKLLARGGLIFLHDFVGHPLHHRIRRLCVCQCENLTA